MRLVFSRGTLVKAADAKPFGSQPAALTFSWEGLDPSGRISGGSREDSVALEKVGDALYRAGHEAFGAIFLAKTPWWSELPSPIGERGVWLSYQGFSSGIWQDGIFGRFEDGQWTDIVLAGAPFSLEFGRSRLALDGLNEFWADEKHAARKQSLIACVRASYAQRFLVPTLIRQAGSHTDFVLNLLLLRLAFPKSRFVLKPLDASWKRLAQNLNIDVLKGAFPGPEIMALDSLGPQGEILELLRWQQAKSPFIPQNLWTTLLG